MQKKNERSLKALLFCDLKFIETRAAEHASFLKSMFTSMISVNDLSMIGKQISPAWQAALIGLSHPKILWAPSRAPGGKGNWPKLGAKAISDGHETTAESANCWTRETKMPPYSSKMELKNEIITETGEKGEKGSQKSVCDGCRDTAMGSWSQPALPEGFFSLVLACCTEAAMKPQLLSSLT